jgi:hypothetical protein
MATVSPELALVDPELRARALSVLPRVSPYAFLERPDVEIVPLVPAPAFRPSAAAAYVLVALARTCAVNVAVFAGVAALVLLLNLFA